MLSDLESAQSQLDRAKTKAKGQDKDCLLYTSRCV